MGQKQLMVVMPYKDKFCANVNQPDSDELKSWSFVGNYCSYWDTSELHDTKTPIAVAAGRVDTPLRDDAFGVTYLKSTGGYEVSVFSLKKLLSDDSSWSKTVKTFSHYGCESTLNTVDIATGDIDGATDKDGQTHEEIVIAYKGYNSDCQTNVYVTAMAVKDGEAEILCTVNLGLIYEGFLSLSMGDYNSDGLDEIAVSWPSQDNGVSKIFETQVLVYDGDAKQLQARATISDTFSFIRNMVDLASGDFDGDGQDEIGAVFGHYSFDHDRQYRATLNLYDVDLANQKMALKGQYGIDDDSDWWKSSVGASIASGLFKYDPDDDYSTARRQIAVARIAWNKNQWDTLYVDIFDIDDKLDLTLMDTVQARDTTCLYTYAYKPEIVAGRFHTLSYKGTDNGSQTAMSDQIAVSYPEVHCHGDDNTPIMKFNVLEVDNREEKKMKLTVSGNSEGICFYPGKEDYSQTDYAASASMVAACAWKGESYYLGDPVHITVPNVLKAIRIIQEPPKHIDYLPDQDGEWKIMNVSRWTDFIASFEQSTEESITTSTTCETDWDIGGSESVSAEETFSEGIPDITSVEVTASQEEETSYDYESVTEKENKNYKSMSFGEEFNTTLDDAVQYETLWLDIWRYRVYGLKTKDGKNAFYEVHLPGNISTCTMSGTQMSDYYQPVHENGNLLSYPIISDSNPEDLGSFSVNGISTKGIMTERNLFTYGKIEGTVYLKWENSEYESETATHKSTYDESLVFKMGFKGEASSFFGGATSPLTSTCPSRTATVGRRPPLLKARPRWTDR